MRRRLIALVVTGASVLAACAPTVHEACVKDGFEPGTEAYFKCRTAVAQERAQRRADDMRALLLFRALTPPPSAPVVIQPPPPAYVTPPPVIIQPRPPSAGESIQPTIDLLRPRP